MADRYETLCARDVQNFFHSDETTHVRSLLITVNL